MTNSPLPESGASREIFLKALRMFSEECEPPELLAECPFSIDLSTGGRGCGEECLELLDRYGVPQSASGIPMGIPEVAAYPMGRTKRPKSHVKSLKPFDAGENFYRDSDDPDRSTWETVSLFYSLKSEYLSKPDMIPDSPRNKKLFAAVSELRARRFNVDELLRLGLRSYLAETLAVAIMLPGMLAAQPSQSHGEADSAEAPDFLAPPPAGWREMLDEYMSAKDPLPPNMNELPAAIHGMKVVFSSEFFGRLHIWAGTAPVDDLISWQPPTIDEFLAYDLGTEPEIMAQGRKSLWIVDRFTETYIKDWNTDSLKLEWRYQQGSVEPPCPHSELAARKVDSNDLARTLAQATAIPASDKLPQIKSTAVRLLISGRRDTAAAMFDAARQESWDDAEIQNNYGFCLLLDNPSEALKAFEIAVELGFRLTVNTCNRILALFKLGHHAAALEVADQAIDRWSDLDAQESYLWDFEAAEPTLLAHANPRQYLLDLATHVAKESTDELVAARWIALRSRLGANAGS